jgi:hypothetical protein
LEALADLKVALADSSCGSRQHVQSLSYFFKMGSKLIMGEGPPLLLSMGLSTCPFHLNISWAGFLVQIWLGGLVTGCFH